MNRFKFTLAFSLALNLLWSGLSLGANAQSQMPLRPVVHELPAGSTVSFEVLSQLQTEALKTWQTVRAAQRQVPREQIEALLAEAGTLLQPGPQTSKESLNQALQALRDAQILMMPSRVLELRGALLDADLLSPDPAAIAKLLDRLQAAGFNAVFPEVFRRGYALFPNRLIEMEPRYARRELDMLQELVSQAQQRGLEVYPWLWTYRVFSPSLSTENPIQERFPALLSSPVGKPAPVSEGLEDEATSFVSPASPEWRELFGVVLADMVRKYKVQGLLLDYVRYGNQATEDQLSKTRFQLDYFRKVGALPPKQIDPASDLQGEWHLWRENQVHQLVQGLRLNLSSLQPDLSLGAAVFRNEVNARNTKMQNWRHWSQHNWVDFVAPMMYANSIQQLDLWLDWESDMGQRQDLLYPILGLQSLRTPGELFNQIGLLQQRQIPGMALFAVRQLNDQTLSRLKQGPFRRPARVPHHNLPAAVALQVQSIAGWLESSQQAPEFRAALQSLAAALAGSTARQPSLAPDLLMQRLRELQGRIPALPLALQAEAQQELAYALTLAARYQQQAAQQRLQAPTRPPSQVQPEARPLPEIQIPFLTSQLTIDGQLDEPAWQQAARIPALWWSHGSARPQANTQVRLAYDAEALYLGYTNAEPRMDRLSARYRIDGNEQLVHQGDDTVEVFLSPGDKPSAYYYFVLNPGNTRFHKASFDSAWQGAWQSRASTQAAGWQTEMRIPFSSLSVAAPLQGGSWKGNFCRRRPQEIAPYHCWSFTFGGVHRTDRFGTLRFAPRPAAASDVP